MQPPEDNEVNDEPPSLNDINMIPKQIKARKMGSSLPVRQIWGLAKKIKPNPASG